MTKEIEPNKWQRAALAEMLRWRPLSCEFVRLSTTLKAVKVDGAWKYYETKYEARETLAAKGETNG